MKKRFLSVILALCLSLLSTVVLATDGDGDGGGEETVHADHCVCGATHSDVGDHTTENVLENWTGVSALSEITQSGNYYLKSDVTLEEYWQKVEAGVNVVLCLNGHTINVKNNDPDDYIRVNGGTLTLTDCKGGASITGISPRGYGKVVRMIGTTSVLNLYAVTIKNIRVDNSYYGGGVRNTGVFNMYSGSIEGNASSGSGSLGGGVYNEGSSTFNMYGGTIKDNTITSSGVEKGEDMYIADGASVYANAGTVAGGVVNKGTITVTDGYEGGTFSGTVTNRGTIGGGTFGGAVTNSGTIRGGTFSGTVTNSGTISDGTFSDTVTNSGTINGGTFQSTITNNGVIVFQDDSAYQSNKENISGTGYVQVGSGDNAAYYLCDGTKLEGVSVTLTKEKVSVWLAENNSATLIVASYKGEALKDVKTIRLTSKRYEKSLTAIGIDTSDADKTKAFLWTDITTQLIPLCEAQES